MTAGIYQLHLRLPHATTIEVGRLGTFRFPAGWYVYTGSAMGGLEVRVRRHLRREKKLKWHVDYLLQHAPVRSVVIVPTTERLECAWNERTLAQPGARVMVERFGSSDCRCASHLIYFGRRKPPNEILRFARHDTLSSF
jgi:Uri superfamily endonuclease